MKLVVHKQVLYFAVESIVKIRELFSLFVCSLKYGINGFVLIWEAIYNKETLFADCGFCLLS